jgi:hypothetical protein
MRRPNSYERLLADATEQADLSAAQLPQYGGPPRAERWLGYAHADAWKTRIVTVPRNVR